MNKVIKKLKNKYKAIEQASSKDFFLEIKNYIDFISTEKKIRKILDKLKERKDSDSLQFRQIRDSIIKFFVKTKKNLQKLIKKSKKVKKNEAILNLLKQFDNYIKGKVRSSAPLEEDLYFTLEDIFSILKKNKIKIDDIYKNFIEKWREFLPTKENYDQVKRTSVWNSFDELCLIKILDKDRKKLDLLGLWFLHNIKRVVEGYEELSQEERERYMRNLQRIHAYLLEELGFEVSITQRITNILNNPLVKIIGSIIVGIIVIYLGYLFITPHFERPNLIINIDDIRGRSISCYTGGPSVIFTASNIGKSPTSFISYYYERIGQKGNTCNQSIFFFEEKDWMCFLEHLETEIEEQKCTSKSTPLAVGESEPLKYIFSSERYNFIETLEKLNINETCEIEEIIRICGMYDKEVSCSSEVSVDITYTPCKR